MSSHRIFILPVYLTLAAFSSASFGWAQSTSAMVGQPAVANLPAEAPPPTTPLPATTYTVKSGGTLRDLAKKFHCSVAALEQLNHLTKKTRLTKGQVVLIPPPEQKVAAALPTKKTAKPAPKLASAKHKTGSGPAPVSLATESYAGTHRAQPVQDFDIGVPASTFASCPVPVASSDQDEDAPDAAAPKIAEVTPAPRAAPVDLADVPPATAPAPREVDATQPQPAPVPIAAAAPAVVTTPAPRQPNFFERLFGSHSAQETASGEWGNRFLTAARNLADRGIGYDESWRPEGEAHAWEMDCSNTSRYLYQTVAGIELPRTASDQYYYLHLQDKAWDVPTAGNGFADCNYLRAHLKPGDLLFWENTYRPERQPPITHVMIFLGSNARGQWIMAGSQTSRGGEHNRSNGGPDVYVFDPTRPCGGYSTWLGLVHHQGRFCAYGRPLEADVKKLAVATTN